MARTGGGFSRWGFGFGGEVEDEALEAEEFVGGGACGVRGGAEHGRMARVSSRRDL